MCKCNVDNCRPYVLFSSMIMLPYFYYWLCMIYFKIGEVIQQERETRNEQQEGEEKSYGGEVAEDPLKRKKKTMSLWGAVWGWGPGRVTTDWGRHPRTVIIWKGQEWTAYLSEISSSPQLFTSTLVVAAKEGPDSYGSNNFVLKPLPLLQSEFSPQYTHYIPQGIQSVCYLRKLTS